MKKFLKITITTIAIIILLLFLLPLLFVGKIETIIKQEGNKMLNAEFDFAELDISLIRNFPLASLSLEDFYLKGVGTFENDTLLSAGEITAAVNLMSLFGDEGYDIHKILLDNVSVKAIVQPDSSVNWDVMKPSEEEVPVVEDSVTEASPFRIKLEELEINNLNIIYDDRLADMYAQIKGLDATCSGDFGNSRTIIDIIAETDAVTYSLEGVPFVNNAVIAANMKVDADLENNKFTFNENSLQLNAIKAGIDGWVAVTDAGMDMDVRLNSNEIGFKEILSLIPAIYAKDFEGLKTDGTATVDAYAKGVLIGDSIVPEFNLAFDVKNAMFQYPSLPANVNNINILAKVSNPGGSPDATVVNINPFNFVMAGNPFGVVATLQTPMSDMHFDVAAKGKLDLGKVKDIYPLEDMQLNGIVDADININGKMSYIENEDYEKVKANGKVLVNNMLLKLEDMPDVDIKKSLLTFTPKYLQLSETTINIGENDITLDSKFENYMGYALKGSTLKGTLNVKSNRLNLNDFMSSDSAGIATDEKSEEVIATTDTIATGIIEVPKNIDFRMQTDFKKVLFDNMTFENVQGLLVVKDSKVDMKNLSLRTMGGDVVVNGYYYTPKKVEPEFNAGFKLNNIAFATAYKDLNVVRKLAPIFEGLTGNFSGNVNIDTKLDNTMSPIISSLTGGGSLETKDLSLNNVKVIQMVADIVQKPALKDTRVKDIDIDFTIKDGRVNTKPFDVRLGDYKMNLSGSTGLDQTIDYKGEITIPTSAGKVAELGTVDMLIGGTFTSPKVSIDMASLAKKTATKAAEKVIDKILGKKTDDTTDAGTENEATDVNNKKAEAAEKLINKAFDLFKKK